MTAIDPMRTFLKGAILSSSIRHFICLLAVIFLPSSVVAGSDSLEVPEELVKQMKIDNPGYNLPAEKDVKGPWLFLKGKMGDDVPYFTKGDYNGDGKTDYALYLFSQEKPMFVLYEKTAGGYKRALFSDDSNVFVQGLVLSTIQKGNDFVFIYEENGKEKELREKYSSDVLVRSDIEGPTEVIYYSSSKKSYQFDLFGSH